jgi:hypothetical protein
MSNMIENMIKINLKTNIKTQFCDSEHNWICTKHVLVKEAWCFTSNQLTTWKQHKAMFCVEIKSMLNGNEHKMLNPWPLSLLCLKSDDYLDFWTRLLSILSSLLRIARLFFVNMFIIHGLWKVIFPCLLNVCSRVVGKIFI